MKLATALLLGLAASLTACDNVQKDQSRRLEVTDEPNGQPIRLEVSVDRQLYAFRAAISITIRYMNDSQKPVELIPNGLSANEGFPGESFEIQSDDEKKTYAIFAVDPLPSPVIRIEPGKSWTRTIEDLAPVLSNSGVTINDMDSEPDDKLPDPFGHVGPYTLRVMYEPTTREGMQMALESNTVSFDVELR